MCPCSCAYKAKLEFWKKMNFTTQQMLEYMAPLMKEVMDDMKLDKKKISKNIRKRTSAPDERKSAQQMGVVGIVVISVAFGMIIIFDILAIRRYAMLVRGIWNRV